MEHSRPLSDYATLNVADWITGAAVGITRLVKSGVNAVFNGIGDVGRAITGQRSRTHAAVHGLVG